MENIQTQKEEALKSLSEYLEKLIPSVNKVILELRENKQEDTPDYLDMIIKGINWSIQVMNGTFDVINQNKEILNKEDINNRIKNFSNAFATKDDLKIADSLSGDILSFLNKLKEAITIYA